METSINVPQPGEKWRHYKGGIYTVCRFVWGAEGDDLELRIVYCNENGMRFSRPIANFLEPLKEQNCSRFTRNGT